MHIIFTVFFLICHIEFSYTLLEVTRTITTDKFKGIECANVGNGYELTKRNCSCDFGKTLLFDQKDKTRCLSIKQIKNIECENLEVLLQNNLISADQLFQDFYCDFITPTELQWWNYRKLQADQDIEQGVWEVHEELTKEGTLKENAGGTTIKINTEKYNFKGLVLKLVLSCQQETDDSKEKVEEVAKDCVMIKIQGIRKYPVSYNDLLVVPLTTPASTTSTTKTTTLKPKVTTTTSTTTTKKPTEVLANKDTSESDNQTLVIAILIPVILLLIIIVIIMIIIKRKRNKKDQSVEKPSAIKSTAIKPVPPPTSPVYATNSAPPNPYTFDDNEYKELESEYAPSSVASTNQGFIGTSPKRPDLNKQNDTYSDISPKYQGRSDIYTGLNNDAVIYNELEEYSTASNNNYTAPIDETHYHDVDEIENDNYYSDVAGQPHVSPPPYAKVQKYK